MSRFLNWTSELNNLRRVLGFETIYAATRSNFRLRKIDKPEGENVLILATYPHDDVVGMGGTIAKHIKANERVSVIYLCDGSKGTKSGIRDRLLGVKRRKEAKNAGQVLGLDPDKQIFWHYQDGKLTANRTTIEGLKTLIVKLSPDIIYLPNFLDFNSDRFQTNRILMTVLSASKLPIKLYGYETNVPSFINRVVDITQENLAKQSAISQHASQQPLHYLELAQGLNQFRAAGSGIDGFAEGFFCADVEMYMKLFNLLIT